MEQNSETAKETEGLQELVDQNNNPIIAAAFINHTQENAQLNLNEIPTPSWFQMVPHGPAVDAAAAA